MNCFQSFQQNFDTICRKFYTSLARETRQKGLLISEIERSLNELSHCIDGKYYVKNLAYRPTGIALGCPLPDKQLIRILWNQSDKIAKCINTLCPGMKATFAFVPRKWYHATVVNRSHYEFTKITPMSKDEKEKAQYVINKAGRGPIVLYVNGMILTRSGKLLALGLPSDDWLYEMRSCLSKELPKLRVNVPTAAHIKLGHLLAPITGNDLNVLLEELDSCSEHVRARLVFRDMYTPVGRITL